MTAPPVGSTLVAIDPRSDRRWQTISAGGSVFTSPPWIRAVCDCYGFSPQARITVDGEGKPSNGFAWVHINDLRGDRLVSLPFSDRAEPIVSDRAAWPSLIEDPLNAKVPLTIRCLDGAAPTSDPLFVRTGEAAWHGTALAAPLEELHRSLHSSTRRAVATARRRGVDVLPLTGIDGVRTFHEMHLRLRKRKYRLLAQPVEFFERIWEEFSGSDGIVTLLAYADGNPIAGGVLLAWCDTVYLKFAASVPEALSLMPNYAVYWNAIQWAAERGFRLVDWGLSDLDQPGLVAYKRKWATLESRIVTLRTREHDGSTSSESGPLLGGLTTLLTEETVPDAITARAGSLLYRYFT